MYRRLRGVFLAKSFKAKVFYFNVIYVIIYKYNVIMGYYAYI